MGHELELETQPDGRIQAGYRVFAAVGEPTGRVSQEVIGFSAGVCEGTIDALEQQGQPIVRGTPIIGGPYVPAPSEPRAGAVGLATYRPFDAGQTRKVGLAAVVVAVVLVAALAVGIQRGSGDNPSTGPRGAGVAASAPPTETSADGTSRRAAGVAATSPHVTAPATTPGRASAPATATTAVRITSPTSRRQVAVPPTTAPRRARPVQVRIDPSRWVSAASGWDRLGPTYEENPAIANLGATHTHAYGNDTGAFAYRFSLPSAAGRGAEVTARLSSNFPYYSAPSDGFSDVTLVINGSSTSLQRVIPDNGTGANYTWRIDPHLLRTGVNTLGFAVRSDATYRNGLCIYYKAVVPGEADEPIVVQMRR